MATGQQSSANDTPGSPVFVTFAHSFKSNSGSHRRLQVLLHAHDKFLRVASMAAKHVYQLTFSSISRSINVKCFDNTKWSKIPKNLKLRM